MDEVRAALAIARKDVIMLTRYRVSVFALVFTPLYQGVVPAFLFGASFAVGGRSLGLASSIGTENLAGFIFLGGVVSGLVATAFWQMAWGLRNEMDNGTLEPSWLTPTRRDTFVIGRALAGMTFFIFSQVSLFAIGIGFFGLRFDAGILRAVPALVVAVVAMIGVGYLVAAAVLLVREANFLVDSTNYLFAIASGSAFPITLLPGLFQGMALLLPTTYALDLLRQSAIGSRPLFDPTVEFVALLAVSALVVPLGRRVFDAADHRMRVTGGLAQH